MALMALLSFLSLVRNLRGVLAAPPLYKISMMIMPSEPTSLSTADAGLPSPFFVIPWADPHRNKQAAVSVVIPITTTTVTLNVAQEPTVFIPVSPTPTAVSTDVISSQTLSPSAAPSPSLGSFEEPKNVWVAPARMDDLTSFGITHFSDGKNNFQIVTELPANASADGSKTKSDNSSIFQVFYPKGSISPSKKPVGGAEFYATPIDISSARNVSLGYSAFFPADFDFVYGGKMPGLYGGHISCSGGVAALDCFSTRLMWRIDGDGELYLYAPKTEQTKDLCSAPGSHCNTDYGLSIGRGSFTWATGNWTTVLQTIVLNTPGKQDGIFTLYVNGQSVIDRHDVYYREDRDDNGAPVKQPKPTKSAKPTAGSGRPEDEKDGGLLGGILGGLELFDPNSVVSTQDPASTTSEIGSQSITTIPPTPTVFVVADDTVSQGQISFVGIFFSTFFGGHEDKYATPKDQNVFFKDFSLIYNS